MNHYDNSDDGYEDDPWKDDPPGELVPVKDFLPPAALMRNALTYLRQDGATLFMLSPEDLRVIEAQAEQEGVSAPQVMAGILHDYASGRLVRSS